VRFAFGGGWQISVSADEPIPVFALWLRDVEAIGVAASPLVPGPLDMGELPPPQGEAHDPLLGEEWLAWWTSLVDRRPRQSPLPPDERWEPAHDTPDPLGLARLAVLRGHVTRRWTEFLHWRTAYQRAHGTFATRRSHGDHRDHDIVRQVEDSLGRKVAPFSLRFTLLPVRDVQIRLVEVARYLVPERVYLGSGWPARLRALVAELA
jgi:hypothetical protein